jgi:hypothetical protein
MDRQKESSYQENGEKKGTPNCSHPDDQRTPLASGQGYRCETCKTVVRDQTQEICVSPAAETAGLTKDENLPAGHKNTGQRREELKAINDAAELFLKNWKAAESIGNELIKLHQKFSDVFEASRPLLETVLDGFAHLRKGEEVQGCTTAKVWCRKVLGVSYERVRQLRTARLRLAEPITIITDKEDVGERPADSATSKVGESISGGKPANPPRAHSTYGASSKAKDTKARKTETEEVVEAEPVTIGAAIHSILNYAERVLLGFDKNSKGIAYRRIEQWAEEHSNEVNYGIAPETDTAVVQLGGACGGVR